jgi:hypothetical protein
VQADAEQETEAIDVFYIVPLTPPLLLTAHSIRHFMTPVQRFPSGDGWRAGVINPNPRSIWSSPDE